MGQRTSPQKLWKHRPAVNEGLHETRSLTLLWLARPKVTNPRWQERRQPLPGTFPLTTLLVSALHKAAPVCLQKPVAAETSAKVSKLTRSFSQLHSFVCFSFSHLVFLNQITSLGVPREICLPGTLAWWLGQTGQVLPLWPLPSWAD